jgi:hypothetical protein
VQSSTPLIDSPIARVIRAYLNRPVVELTELRPESAMRSYQVYLADSIERTPALLAAAEMSLGKTAAALTGTRRLMRRHPHLRTLIVAPLEVAKHTWPEEITAWEHFRDVTYTQVIGTAEERAAALKVDADYTIINRENLRWLWRKVRGPIGWRWQILIYDESSRLKGFTFKTKGTKQKPARLTEFGVLAKARSKFKRVIELTGTPAPNGVIDLGGQMYLIDQGVRLGPNKTQFHNRYFETDPYNTFGLKPRAGAEDQIMDLVKEVMIGLRAEDYIDLPEKIYNPRYVYLPTNLMRQYREFEKTLYAEQYDVEAVSRGVLTNKLLQFCIAKGTKVLTITGWRPIETISAGDQVWDGETWVRSGGHVFQGIRPVINCYGVSMTKDHEVLTVVGWKQAQEARGGSDCAGFERAKVRIPYGHRSSRNFGKSQSFVETSLCLRKRSYPSKSISALYTSQSNTSLWLQTWRECFERTRRSYDDRYSSVENLEFDERSLSRSQGQRFSELWWSRNRYARRMVQFISSFLARCARRIFGRFDYRSSEQQRILFEDKLSMGYFERTRTQSTDKCVCGNTVGEYHNCRGSGESELRVPNCVSSLSQGREGEDAVTSCQTAEVYDLMDCGPNRRFVVRGSDGPVIVHNCNGGLYRKSDTDMKARDTLFIHDLKLDALESIIEEAAGQQILVAYSFEFDRAQLRKRFPKAVFYNEEPDFKRLWDRKKIGVGICHPANIGHGMNFQAGGNIQVWYGLTWSLELWQQFNQRLARPGQADDHVFIHMIMAKKTEDEKQYANLIEKGITQDRITERIRIRLAERGVYLPSAAIANRLTAQRSLEDWL